MIIYALIVRSRDGLPLSASTDFNDEGMKSVKDSKRYLKLLAKKAYQYPDKCLLNSGPHCVYMLSALNVTYLALCDVNYPTVLAFSFLNELMKEFLSKYQVTTAIQARRPYSFIDFNHTIHSARQRYNKPQSLSTRINLAELSEEIRLHPPHQVTIPEIEPINNFGLHISPIFVGPRPKLEPLTLPAYASIVLAVLLVAIDFFRSKSAYTASGYEELYYSSGLSHGFIFYCEGFFRILQIAILLLSGRKLLKQSWACVVILAILGISVWDLRDVWQNGLRVFVTAIVQWFIIKRKFQLRLPDYNV